MNKIEYFFEKVYKKIKVFFLWFQSLFTVKEEHTLLKSLSTGPVRLTPFLKVTTVPSTFVKTFVYDHAEEIDDKVNHYAEDNELEIKSISIIFLDFSNVFSATVVFERSVER